MFIKLNTNFDIEKLKLYLDTVTSYSAPLMKKNSAWGGWSITSSDGTVQDGWQGGERLFAENISPEAQQKLQAEFKAKKFNIPTPLYTPLIADIISQLGEMDLEFLRIRIALLKPHDEKESYWHQDGKSADNYFKLRLHIPIITNEKCLFEYPDKKFHLPADGSAYIIEVSKPHRVLNLSNENRYHLMMDLHSLT